jgi:putative spermidine/putrescine transport system permease protein
MKSKLAKIYIAAIITLIYLPAAFMIVLSFKSGANISFPIERFTLDWYIKPPAGEYAAYLSLFHDRQVFQALQNSVVVSTIVAILSMLLVTTTALALRRRIAGRDQLFYLFLLGFLTPGVAVGLGLNFLFSFLNWEFSVWSAALINVVYAVPFGLILMMARFNPDLVFYEQAASALKASPFRTFRKITLPLIIYEVISAAILGFLLSWGEVIRTQFALKGIGTLSTFINVQLGVNPLTPKWYAAGTVVSIVSFAGLAVFAYLLSKTTR